MKESLEAKREELEDLAAIAEDIPPVITVQKLLIDDPAYAGLLAREQGVSIGDLTGDKMLAEEPNQTISKFRNIFSIQGKQSWRRSKQWTGPPWP